MYKIVRNGRLNESKRNKIGNTGYIGKNGFSLIEIVFTIIIIGLAMGAITESFIAGSAKSVNIVNEETALNLAKQEMAALNYCRNGGSVGTKGQAGWVCSAFDGETWNMPSNFYTSPQVPPNNPINNECFNTTVTASNVNFNDTNGNGTIILPGNSSFIQVIVQTGWFSANGGGTCPAAPANYPYVTLSTVYAHY